MKFNTITQCSIVAFSLLWSMHAVAQDTEQQRSYRFTQAFSECVKQHRGDAYSNEEAGAAMSGLMNGASLSNGQPMDSRYWQYMDCLDKSVSGTAQANLPVAKTCKPSVTLPAGVEGKKIIINGATLYCTNGTWASSGGGGEPTLPGDGGERSCSASTVSEGQCSVQTPDMNSGKSEVISTTKWINGGFYSFDITLSCQNGQKTIHKKTCVKQECESGAKLTWFSNSSGIVDRCEGTVDNSGAVSHVSSNHFFRSLIEAKTMTKAKIGNADFMCESGKWKITDGNCRAKTINELTCTERAGLNGITEYSCN